MANAQLEPEGKRETIAQMLQEVQQSGLSYHFGGKRESKWKNSTYGNRFLKGYHLLKKKNGEMLQNRRLKKHSVQMILGILPSYLREIQT